MRFFKSIFLFLIVSCSYSKNKSKEISNVHIYYEPAFDNWSVLHLDREEGIALFTVDTMTTTNIGRPNKIVTQIDKLNQLSDFNRFWDPDFLTALRIDTTRSIPTDGMSVWIYYGNNIKTDSIYLGNNPNPYVTEILRENLNSLLSQTKDTATRWYIHELLGYLN